MSDWIFNSSKSTRYYEIVSNKLIESSQAIFPSRINSAALTDCLSNGLFVLRKPGIYRPVAGVLPIPGKSRWLKLSNGYKFFETVWYKSLQAIPNIKRVEKIVKTYLRHLTGKLIAVELSGGLDTALIIELLRRYDVKLAMVGFVSSEYEFRTEHFIQDYYLNYAHNYKMIDYRNCGAFGRLLETPVHPFPVADSLYHFRHNVIASAAKELGAKVLLNGNAGDSLLGHGFAGRANWSVPFGYDPWSITDMWTVETIFKPKGIDYVCPFAFNSLVRLLISLRRHEDDDPMKLWARKMFRDILPPQLSLYAYKASHDGWVADGLKSAEQDIRELLRTVGAIVPDERLNIDKMLSIASNYFLATSEEQHMFLIKLSFLVWVYAFIREGFLN
jgi:hypothetical protein